ncbi:MurR/RpiR family transcriptional regulator [Brevibacillus sp. SYP-B805]|uniref:MurR/RpiR family transcriptional regulator n=1 Tax=Brevibacillus sp. SYP-B805 TaxID=1578199 RepID=UPI0013EB8054|nr:MurR/RpiR family transcriptional regulator [Brevibacillus sp. SYP-B805]NGQ95938.1 MurR/RpiR family transcriptional regulator [Brevibacillus sp. SYP-B805]
MSKRSSHKPISVFARIRATYPQLSAKEQQVADYILEHPGEIIHLSITALSDLCDCAEATIFRLCRRLNFRGYQALKIALASEVVAPLQNIHQEVQPQDDMAMLAEKIFTTDIETLQDTLQITKANHETLARIIDLLVGARRIEFYGMGGSALIAQDAYHKFMRIGIPAVHHADSHYQVMSASLLGPGDVVVAFSHSGSSKDILEALKVAKEAGATVIGITGYGKSPLVKLADYCLFTTSRETAFRTEALSSRLAQLSLIDLLYVAVSFRRQEETVNNIRKIREAISLKRL